MAIQNNTLPKNLTLRNGVYYARVNVNGVRYSRSLKCGDFETALERLAAYRQNVISIHAPERNGFLYKSSNKNKDWIEILYKSAKKRSVQKGLEFTLSIEDIKELGARSGMKCEVSGIPFSWDKPEHCRVAPYIPSLDRIDCTHGYTKENVRLICWAVNISMSDWGDEAFIKICKAVVVQILHKL